MSPVEWIEIIKLFGIPGAVTGVIIWLWQRSWAKKEATREQKERNREQLELIMLESIQAATAVSRATAEAVQRIPEFKCNGDMTKALEYESKVKHRRREFLDGLGVHALHED